MKLRFKIYIEPYKGGRRDNMRLYEGAVIGLLVFIAISVWSIESYVKDILAEVRTYFNREGFR